MWLGRSACASFALACLGVSACGKSSEPDSSEDASTNHGIDHGYVPGEACSPGAACGDGVECVELVTGGVAACVSGGGRPTMTCSGDARDECCESSECAEGSCYPVTQYPSGRCGLGGADVYNRCQSDECASDADCPDGFCALGSRRTCMTGACRSDADCVASPHGVCRALDLGCCPSGAGARVDRTLATACVYPGDGCTKDSDCPSGSVCTVESGRAACRSECAASSF